MLLSHLTHLVHSKKEMRNLQMKTTLLIIQKRFVDK